MMAQAITSQAHEPTQLDLLQLSEDMYVHKERMESEVGRRADIISLPIATHEDLPHRKPRWAPYHKHIERTSVVVCNWQL